MLGLIVALLIRIDITYSLHRHGRQVQLPRSSRQPSSADTGSDAGNMVKANIRKGDRSDWSRRYAMAWPMRAQKLKIE